MATPSTPVLDQLVQAIGKVAMAHGVPGLVIIGLDPKTNQSRVYGSPQALQMFRRLVAEKFNLLENSGDNEAITEWPSG